MYGINSEPPKNCLDCPLCQGEYGKGNEKSYCAINPKVKLKYRGSRPKECPIIVDPLPQWQIEFLSALINKAIERGEWIKKEDVVRRMTNAEKYKEIFDMEVDPDMCPTKDCSNCPCCKDCHTDSTFWKNEYKKGGAE